MGIQRRRSHRFWLVVRGTCPYRARPRSIIGKTGNRRLYRRHKAPAVVNIDAFREQAAVPADTGAHPDFIEASRLMAPGIGLKPGRDFREKNRAYRQVGTVQEKRLFSPPVPLL